jgi:hypothetical protein
VGGILPSTSPDRKAGLRDTLAVACLIVQPSLRTDDAREEVIGMTSIARPFALPRTISVSTAEVIAAVAVLIGALTVIALGLLPPDVANPWHLLPGGPDLALRSLV